MESISQLLIHVGIWAGLFVLSIGAFIGFFILYTTPLKKIKKLDEQIINYFTSHNIKFRRLKSIRFLAYLMSGTWVAFIFIAAVSAIKNFHNLSSIAAALLGLTTLLNLLMLLRVALNAHIMKKRFANHPPLIKLYRQINRYLLIAVIPAILFVVVPSLILWYAYHLFNIS